jgi:hypothetical protein
MFVATHCFIPPFRKANFCGVSPGDIVKVGCVVGKKKEVSEHFYRACVACRFFELYAR